MLGNHYEKARTANAAFSFAYKSLTKGLFFLVELVVKKDGSLVCKFKRTEEAQTIAKESMK